MSRDAVWTSGFISLDIPYQFSHTDSREIDWSGCFDFSFLFLTPRIFITLGVKILILIHFIFLLFINYFSTMPSVL